MYSVKSETECITTIGTVNSRLAHTLAMRTEAKITLLLQTVACLQGHLLAVQMGNVLLMLRKFFGLGLSLF